jgi:pimeloyl-ACP methyl ester carboxylesterase
VRASRITGHESTEAVSLCDESHNTTHEDTMKSTFPQRFGTNEDMGSKARILCLHGYAQNANFFRVRTGSLRKQCRAVADFVYLDAPYPATASFLSQDGVDGDDRGEKLSWWSWEESSARASSSQHYEGMQVDRHLATCALSSSLLLESHVGPTATPPLLHPASHPSSLLTPPSCPLPQETIERVRAFVATEGPFDGILGFSQGAALAALLCASPEAQINVRFAVLISGFVPRDTRYQSILDAAATTEQPEDALRAQQLPLRTLHVLGTLDDRVPPESSRRLSRSFPNPELYEWEGGHTVPWDGPFRRRLKDFIAECVIDDDQDRGTVGGGGGASCGGSGATA